MIFSISVIPPTFGTRHLEHTLKVSVDHDNRGRRQRSVGLFSPNGRPLVKPNAIGETINVRRRDRLGGLLHEYERAASATTG
jgi:hypothetical protein